ncbi:dienelactone hydrolase [Bradyrhizobium sp. GM24.11]
MVRLAAAMSRTRAAATKRTMRAQAAPPRKKFRSHWTICKKQNFIRKDAAVVIGHSAGGWGALALANADPKKIFAITVFAPGRGGHANDEPNKVCAPHTLLVAAAEFGKAARIPVTSLVAANDSYFAPAFSKALADAFRSGGGKDDFRTLPAVGSEGHWMIETEAGVQAASGELARALNLPKPVATKKP